MHLKNVPAKWWKYILIAIHALLLTYVCYVAGNVAYSLGSEVQTVKWLNTIRSWLFDNKEELPDELMPISVSYDKQLIDVSDQYGMPLGVIDITDRNKLYRLLSAIDSVGNYKYVMCDMTFSAEYETDVDSALYALISRMPRIVVAGGEHADLLPEFIRRRAFSAGYNISIEESNFVKYPLVSNGRESMALQMWKDAMASDYVKDDFLMNTGIIEDDEDLEDFIAESDEVLEEYNEGLAYEARGEYKDAWYCYQRASWHHHPLARTKMDTLDKRIKW